MPRILVSKQPDTAIEHSLRQMGSTDVQTLDVRVDTRRYSVVVSRDPLTEIDSRWHVSIAGERDVPRWADLAAIGHEVRPGVAFAVGVPPRSWWMNVHQHCLHLWETKDENLLAQWRRERQGHTPT